MVAQSHPEHDRSAPVDAVDRGTRTDVLARARERRPGDRRGRARSPGCTCASSPIPPASASSCSRNGRGSSCAPSRPRTWSSLRLVAAERRRRAGMRAVHLAPPDAVDARLAALAAGFDDALTTDDAGAGAGGPAQPGSTRRHDGGPASGPCSPLPTGSSWTSSATSSGAGPTWSTSVPRSTACWRCWRPTRAAPTAARSCSTASGDRTAAAGCGRSTSTCAGSGRRSSRCPNRPVHLITVRGVGYRLDPPPR